MYNNQKLCQPSKFSGDLSAPNQGLESETVHQNETTMKEKRKILSDRLSEIRSVLSEGKLEESLDLLQHFIVENQPNFGDEAIQLKARLSELKKKVRLGQMESEDESRIRANINRSVLDLTGTLNKILRKQPSTALTGTLYKTNWKNRFGHLQVSLKTTPQVYFLIMTFVILGVLSLWSVIQHRFEILTDKEIIGKLILASSSIGLIMVVLTYKNFIRRMDNNGITLQKNHALYQMMVVAVVLLGLSFTNQIFFDWKEEVITINEEPEKAANLNIGEGHVKWFNGLFRLAENELSEKYLKSVTEGNIKYQLLLLDCNSDEESQENSRKKFNQMRAFLQKMNALAQDQNVMITDEHFEVKMVETDKMPGLSYYTTLKKNEPTLIMYIEDGLVSGGVPEVGLETQFSYLVKEYGNQFENYWEDGKLLNLEDLLNEKIEDKRFFVKN